MMHRDEPVARCRAIRKAGVCAALLLAGVLAAGPASAQEALRPAVGKPLAAARSYLIAHNFPKAMAAVRQADAVPGKSAYESQVIAQMTAAIASESGDNATVSQLITSGRIPAGEALKLMHNEISIASRQRNYAQVIYWADRYQKAGGNEPSMRQTVIDATYNLGHVAEATKMQAAYVAAETRGGRAAPEVDLQRLYTYQNKAGDRAGQLATMKLLVSSYPKPLYWENVIDSLRQRPGFASSRLLLDVYRLEFSLSLINKPDEAMDMAELAIQAKLPGLAKDVVDKCYQGGLLGTGPDAPRHARLKALVDKTYAADHANLGKEDAAAASDHDGNALFALGDTYASYGMYDKGLPMMEQGLVKDDLRHPEDAKLELALTYWSAGQKAKALAALKRVGGTDGTADLAQLWLLRFRQA